MDALTAVASQAAHLNGTEPEQHVNGSASTGGQEEVYEPVGSLEAEEAGGPRMPGAGQEAAALKGPVDEQKEHPTSAGQASLIGGGGVGDAAMAAVDDRVDTNELPHTNGDLLQDAPSEDRTAQAEVSYERVANLTGEQGHERAPDMSFDVDQPARLEKDPAAAAPAHGDAEQQRTEAVEPAPGHQETPVPTGQPDLSEPAQPAPLDQAPLPPSSSTSTLQPEQDAVQPVKASTEFQQTTPASLELQSQRQQHDPYSEEASPPSGVPMPLPTSPSSSSAQQQPSLPQEAPPASMDALPEDPAPLPSQLVNHSAPVTDMQLEGPSSSLSEDQKLQQPATQAGDGSPTFDPTLAADQPRVPPTHPDSVVPDPENNSLQKRPFEPDNSIQSRLYQGDTTEPSTKRQKVSPDAEGSPVLPPPPPQEQEQEQTLAPVTDGVAKGQEDADMSMIDQSLDFGHGDESTNVGFLSSLGRDSPPRSQEE